LFQTLIYPAVQTSASKPPRANNSFAMTSQIRESPQIDDSDEDISCLFLTLGPGICIAAANKKADKPCEYCTKQHPQLLREAIGEFRLQIIPYLREALERLKNDASRLPAGRYLCFWRSDRRSDFKSDKEWFDTLREGRENLNAENRKPFPDIIGCKTVENPLQLCEDCVEVMHGWLEEEWIEARDSEEQKTWFTKDGVATYNCLMQGRPPEEDLADVWEERFESDGPESCQRVLGKYEICASDYEFYRRKPGGKEVIDKYYGEDRVRRNAPARS